MPFLRCTAFALLIAFAATPARAAQALSVAAASNLVYALDELNAAFRREAPDVALTATTGASGSLVAQIGHGAPFDVFLSADLEYPQALINAGDAVPASLTTFAVGRLVLWTTRSQADVSSLAAAVADPAIRRLAIAQTSTAPYGRAAREALEKEGLWASVQPRLVTGENITQTAQFVETGNADAGLVALSLVLSPRLKDRGRWTEVPARLHAPLDQGVVITKRGAANPAATRYLAFLRGPEARKILERFGYGVPASPQPDGRAP
jgi:molybdate transport system substrate-binding protein